MSPNGQVRAESSIDHRPHDKSRTLILRHAVASFPGLFFRETVNKSLRGEQSRPLSLPLACALSPLPEGEDQGEGEPRERPSGVSNHSRNCRTARLLRRGLCLALHRSAELDSAARWRSRALGTAPTPCRMQFGDMAVRNLRYDSAHVVR